MTYQLPAIISNGCTLVRASASCPPSLAQLLRRLYLRSSPSSQIRFCTFTSSGVRQSQRMFLPIADLLHTVEACMMTGATTKEESRSFTRRMLSPSGTKDDIKLCYVTVSSPIPCVERADSFVISARKNSEEQDVSDYVAKNGSGRDLK